MSSNLLGNDSRTPGIGKLLIFWALSLFTRGPSCTLRETSAGKHDPVPSHERPRCKSCPCTSVLHQTKQTIGKIGSWFLQKGDGFKHRTFELHLEL